MIDIEKVWAPQIVWYCTLISDRDKLLSAFHQEPDNLWTSVTNYDELSCQIFDDLNAIDELQNLEASDLPDDSKSTLASFVRALDHFEIAHPEFEEGSLLTDEWSAVERSARAALVAAQTWNTNAQTH